MATDDEILNELYPEKKKEPEVVVTPKSEPRYSSIPTPESVLKGASGVVQEAREKYLPTQEEKNRRIEEAYRETGKRKPYPKDEIVDLGKETVLRGGTSLADVQRAEKLNKGLKFTETYNPDKTLVENASTGGIKSVKSVQDAQWRAVTSAPAGVVSSIIAAKGAASEAKLRWEASRVGIGQDEFNRYLNGEEYTYKGKDGRIHTARRSLNDVKMLIDQGKAREATLKQQEAYRRKTDAETKALEAQAAQRYAKSEQIAAQVPSGGNRLVQFGWKEGSFGNGDENKLYVNSQGAHGQIRQRYMPGQATGVSTSLANSRLEIARMKSRVLGGAPSGSINAVHALQPSYGGANIPSTVLKLAGKTSSGYPTLNKGSPVLGKLSPFKKKS